MIVVYAQEVYQITLKIVIKIVMETVLGVPLKMNVVFVHLEKAVMKLIVIKIVQEIVLLMKTLALK